MSPTASPPWDWHPENDSPSRARAATAPWPLPVPCEASMMVPSPQPAVGVDLRLSADGRGGMYGPPGQGNAGIDAVMQSNGPPVPPSFLPPFQGYFLPMPSAPVAASRNTGAYPTPLFDPAARGAGQIRPNLFLGSRTAMPGLDGTDAASTYRFEGLGPQYRLPPPYPAELRLGPAMDDALWAPAVPGGVLGGRTLHPPPVPSAGMPPAAQSDPSRRVEPTRWRSAGRPAKKKRQYTFLTRAQYVAMVASLRRPATPVVPPEFTRKRWRRLMGYYELHEDRPPFRDLAWRDADQHLAIVPVEDWPDIINDIHGNVPGIPLAHHLSLTQTFKEVQHRYQTRLSRSGLTYEKVRTFVMACSCNLRLSDLEVMSEMAASSLSDPSHLPIPISPPHRGVEADHVDFEDLEASEGSMAFWDPGSLYIDQLQQQQRQATLAVDAVSSSERRHQSSQTGE